VRRDGDDRSPAAALGGQVADGADQPLAVVVRHAEVGDEGVGLHDLEHAQGVARARGGVDEGAPVDEERLEDVAGVRIIVDHDEVETGQRVVLERNGRHGGYCRDARERRQDPKIFPGFALGVRSDKAHYVKFGRRPADSRPRGSGYTALVVRSTA